MANRAKKEGRKKIWIKSIVDSKSKPHVAKYFRSGTKVEADENIAKTLIDKKWAEKCEAPK